MVVIHVVLGINWLCLAIGVIHGIGLRFTRATIEAITITLGGKRPSLERQNFGDMDMGTQEHLDPEVAYENAHIAAQDLVARISELLSDLPAPGSDERIHWGHVGDLREINGRLREVVDFMTGSEE